MMRKLLFIAFTALTLVGCSKDDKSELKVNNQHLEMQCLQKFQLETTGAKNVKYKSEDNRIASVDDNGLVTAGVVGSTTIDIEGNGEIIKCSVHVSHTEDGDLEDPKFEFGIGFDEFLDKYKKYGYDALDIYTIGYDVDKGSCGQFRYIYKFKDDSLESIGIVARASDLNILETSYKRIGVYALETFQCIGKKGEYYVFLSLDKKISGIFSAKDGILLLQQYKNEQ